MKKCFFSLVQGNFLSSAGLVELWPFDLQTAIKSFGGRYEFEDNDDTIIMWLYHTNMQIKIPHSVSRILAHGAGKIGNAWGHALIHASPGRFLKVFQFPHVKNWVYKWNMLKNYCNIFWLWRPILDTHGIMSKSVGLCGSLFIRAAMSNNILSSPLFKKIQKSAIKMSWLINPTTAWTSNSLGHLYFGILSHF